LLQLDLAKHAENHELNKVIRLGIVFLPNVATKAIP
jgi:hypothetical protein